MEDSKVDILVDGHAMLLRGLNQVDNFADNATRSVTSSPQLGLTWCTSAP